MEWVGRGWPFPGLVIGLPPLGSSLPLPCLNIFLHSRKARSFLSPSLPTADFSSPGWQQIPLFLPSSFSPGFAVFPPSFASQHTAAHDIHFSLPSFHHTTIRSILPQARDHSFRAARQLVQPRRPTLQFLDSRFPDLTGHWTTPFTTHIPPAVDLFFFFFFLHFEPSLRTTHTLDLTSTRPAP